MSEQDLIHSLETRITELERQVASQEPTSMPRRGLTRPRLPRRVGVLAVAVALLLPGIALANHQFPDVAANNPFHADIDAIVEAGITTGFQDGTYRPSDPVTRQAMAAFMHRGFGRAGLSTYDAPVTPSLTVGEGVYSSNNVFVPVRTLTFTPPGATSTYAPYQYVLLHGVVVLQGKMDSASEGCPCQFTARIRDVSSNAVSVTSTDTFVSYGAVSAGFGWSFTVDAMMAAGPELGTRTYQIELALGYRDTAAQAATFYVDQRTSLSAASFAFGRHGTNAP